MYCFTALYSIKGQKYIKYFMEGNTYIQLHNKRYRIRASDKSLVQTVDKVPDESLGFSYV